jgi:hypothetical protein
MSVRSFGVLILLSVFSFSLSIRAAEDLDGAKRLLIAGKYEAVIENAEAALKNHERDDDWRTLLMRAQLALGRYPEALTVDECREALFVEHSDEAGGLRCVAGEWAGGGREGVAG